MNELTQLWLANSSTITPLQTLWVLFFAGVLCSFIALTYRLCHRGVSYSASFAHTLILMGMVVAIVMLVVGTNLARAFSLVGALSVIRFRTAVKDPKDTGYMFLAMGVGMAVGTGFHHVALIMTVFVSMVMLLLSRIQFVKPLATPVVLTVHRDAQHATCLATLENQLQQATAQWRLLLNESVSGSNSVVSTYQIQLYGKKALSQLTDTLQALDGVQRVIVFDEAHSMQV